MIVYLLYREAPASEIIGAYSAIGHAMEAAEMLDPSIEYWDHQEAGALENGLWRIVEMEVTP